MSDSSSAQYQYPLLRRRNLADLPSPVTARASLGIGTVQLLLTDSTQTIGTAAATDITWGTEVSDTYGFTSGGSATITVPAGLGGIYAATYNGIWSSTAVGTQAGTCCLINGTNAYEQSYGGTLTYGCVELSFIRRLAAGDTIKFSVFHSAGVNRDVTSRFEMVKIAD